MISCIEIDPVRDARSTGHRHMGRDSEVRGEGANCKRTSTPVAQARVLAQPCTYALSTSSSAPHCGMEMRKITTAPSHFHPVLKNAAVDLAIEHPRAMIAVEPSAVQGDMQHATPRWSHSRHALQGPSICAHLVRTPVTRHRGSSHASHAGRAPSQPSSQPSQRALHIGFEIFDRI